MSIDQDLTCLVEDLKYVAISFSKYPVVGTQLCVEKAIRRIETPSNESSETWVIRKDGNVLKLRGIFYCFITYATYAYIYNVISF